MDDVKRYDLQQPDSHMGSAYMQPEDYGDYVTYDDYTALRARLEAVEKDRDASVARWAMMSGKHAGERDNAIARAEAALATARRDAAHIAATMFMDAGITAKREHAAGRMIAAAILAQEEAEPRALIAQEPVQEAP